MKLGPVHHLAITVADLERAEAFYEGVLGLARITRHTAPDGSHRATWIALAGGAFLALERVTSHAPPKDEDPGLHCVAFAIDVAERESWMARLAAAGIGVIGETRYSFYVRDPDGTRVALSHYPTEVGGEFNSLSPVVSIG